MLRNTKSIDTHFVKFKKKVDQIANVVFYGSYSDT